VKLIGYLINAITAISKFIYLLKVTANSIRTGYAGETGTSDIILLIISFIWILAPYILMILMIARHSKKNPEWVTGDTLTSLIVCLFGLFIWADVFYLRPDPQSPVALFFLPPIQVLGFLGITAIFRAIQARS